VLLDFATWMLNNAAMVWNAASYRNQLRIQEALLPDGLMVSPEGFGTPEVPLFSFTYDRNKTKKMIWRPQGDSNPCYRRERAVS
jgi:hypothetical protein